MISYVAGRRVGEPGVIFVDRSEEPPIRRDLSPEASLKIRDHSPTGFEWGYGGSGPSQLALAILLDYFLNVLKLSQAEELAATYYQKFKEHFIAPATSEGFQIEAHEIEHFLIMEGWLRVASAQGISIQPKGEE